jgi:DNA polymerase IV
MILHIDMDAFFASIEQAVNPRLKGKPLIVGSRGNKMHTVVCAASYEAKACGIDSGMPTHEAFKICPGLNFVPAQQGKYIWTSEQIFALLKAYGFQVVYASIDEFQMDIGNSLEPERLAKDIRQQIKENFNITASVGIAKNWLLAKLASKINKPDGLAVFTEETLSAYLKKIPVEKLCGVGESTSQTLHALGVETCFDLYQKSDQFLEQRFGKYGLNLYASLHSNESFALGETESEPKSIGHSYTLPGVSQNSVFIKAWVRLLSEMVAERMRNDDFISQTVHLWLNGPEIGNFGAQKTFQQPTNDGYEIYSRCLKIMAKIAQKPLKIRALGVSCSKLSHPAYPAFLKEEKRREELLKAVDRINSRFGDGSIYPAVIALSRKMA